jgi:redox-sensitive bicupin YhaK (pirin superfamily)
MDTTTATFDVQRADERGHYDHGWLDTYHSFSFADYYDSKLVNWGVLRVFNDDRVAPAEGFPPHPHRDMEILTYVLSGSLEHEDSMGNRGVVGPGGVQYMSAGTGVRHSEFNHSKTEGLHFVQMWVVPKRMGAAPQYGQKDFSIDDRRGRWLAVASGVAAGAAPIEIGQSASFYVCRLEGEAVGHKFAAGRLGFLFVAQGDVQANGVGLLSGDAVRIAGVEDLNVAGSGELLLWDLAPAT